MGGGLPSKQRQQSLAWAALLLFATVVLASALGASANCRKDNFIGTFSSCLNQGSCSSGGCECSTGTSSSSGDIQEYCKAGYFGCYYTYNSDYDTNCTYMVCGPFLAFKIFWMGVSETGHMTIYKDKGCKGAPAAVDFMALKADYGGSACIYTANNGLMPSTATLPERDVTIFACVHPTATEQFPPPSPPPPNPPPPSLSPPSQPSHPPPPSPPRPPAPPTPEPIGVKCGNERCTMGQVCGKKLWQGKPYYRCFSGTRYPPGWTPF